MKSIGIVRRMDELGRIVIPSELRELMGIKKNDSLEFFTKDNQIILKKYQPACLYCGEAQDIVLFREHNICRKCLNELKDL